MGIEYFWRTDATMSYFMTAWYEVCKDSSVAETQAFAENSDIHQFKQDLIETSRHIQDTHRQFQQDGKGLVYSD